MPPAVLDFWGREVGDRLAAELALSLTAERSEPAPQVLSFGKNKIGDAGATALAEALRKAAGVTSVSLAYNRIGDEGAKALARVLGAESTTSCLVALHLDHNRIGATGARALATAAKRHNCLVTLTLAGNPIYDAPLLRSLRLQLEDNNRAAAALTVAVPKDDNNDEEAELDGLWFWPRKDQPRPVWDAVLGCYVHKQRPPGVSQKQSLAQQQPEPPVEQPAVKKPAALIGGHLAAKAAAETAAEVAGARISHS